MSNTPETDAKVSGHIGFYSCATVPADLARRLERERNEAREELRTALQDRHDFHWALKDAARERDEARDCGQEGVCANPPGCQRHWLERNRELVRERDEARKAAQEWRKLYFLQWSIAYDQPLPPDGKPPFPWEESK